MADRTLTSTVDQADELDELRHLVSVSRYAVAGMRGNVVTADEVAAIDSVLWGVIRRMEVLSDAIHPDPEDRTDA